MMQDDRTNGQALAGLFDTDMLMSDEFSRKKPAAPQQAPMGIMDQMDQRHGKFKNGMGLIAHVLGGGDKSTYGDADLLAEQKRQQAYNTLQGNMEQMQPWVDMMNDGDPSTNAMGAYGISQLGGDVSEMFPGMAPNDDPDIVRTTNQYVDSYNEANKGKEGFEPMTFHQGYDIVKNYDAGRRGAQASSVAEAQSDVQQYGSSRDAYITAVEQDAIISDRIANVDKGLEMLESGSVDTGPVVGFLADTFGIGSSQLAELQQMSIEEAMEALQAFKGPTTDFEFGKAELKGFASIFTGEDMNIGTLRSARNSLEKLRKRNMLSGLSHLDAVGQYGSKEQGDRLRGVFQTPESWMQGQPDFSNTPSQFPNAPATGTVSDGYTFKGGDPNDPNNWEQTQ